MVLTYFTLLSFCLDQLSPTRTENVSFIHSAPWYTPELHKMKCHKCRLEGLYRNRGLTVHLQAYKDDLRQYEDALSAARAIYYPQLIHSGSNNPNALFSTINKLLKPNTTMSNLVSSGKCSDIFQTKNISQL